MKAIEYQRDMSSFENGEPAAFINPTYDTLAKSGTVSRSCLICFLLFASWSFLKINTILTPFNAAIACVPHACVNVFDVYPFSFRTHRPHWQVRILLMAQQQRQVLPRVWVSAIHSTGHQLTILGLSTWTVCRMSTTPWSPPNGRSARTPHSPMWSTRKRLTECSDRLHTKAVEWDLWILWTSFEHSIASNMNNWKRVWIHGG